jgi:tetratricopeptide (TPR) repeat protein
MALRLTGTTLASSSAGTAGGATARINSDARPPAAFGPELAARARAQLALAGGNLDGYKALFGQAAEHEDPHARYHARVKLTEEGLTAAASQSSSQARATQLFVAITSALLDALEEEPREPTLLNYAAIALYELWSLDAAHALFTAAARLDPALPHLKRNLEECKRRRRELGRGAKPLRPLHAAVPGLAARARETANRARPAKDLTLSLCMIVKDEEEMLPRCLAAAAPAVDEIVIVDTGSSDRTIEIARSFGARVIEREWTGSFADARNVSFDAATGDWIIYLDADEVLVADDLDRLRAVTGRVWREAFYFVEISYTGEAGDGAAVTTNALRIFRNRPHYRFEGRLHEQIAQNLPTYATGRIEQTPIRVEHFGYLGAVRDAKEKSRRNLDLLRAQQAEDPETSFLHYNIGTEYALLRDHPSAAAEFERAWSLAQRNGEQYYDYVPALLVRLVSALGSSGRLQEALDRAAEALELFPGFTDLVYAQALASVAQGRDGDAVTYFERCMEMGDAPARYGPTRGSGTYLPRISLAQLHVRHGEFEKARELLDWCITEHPDFAGVVQPYATVMLALGASPDAVADEIETRIPELSPSVRFILAGALYRHGAMQAAEQQYRAALAARPTSFHIRTGLAEALLHQGRYADAAVEAAHVAEDHPFAALAARIELWGRIASKDFEAAAGALAGAAQAGVPAVELEAFAAWLELARDSSAGGTPTEPRSLPIAATPLLGVILETELGLHDFETFETLVKLLDRSALPQREQRELLASMYLAHGFLASAAQEWMAVCEARPDARALLGLARVAERHGELDDAAVFASEALCHDPSNSAARHILTRCAPRHNAEPAAMR